MAVVLCEEAEGHGGHRVVAPGAVQAAEQGTALLQVAPESQCTLMGIPPTQWSVNMVGLNLNSKGGTECFKFTSREKKILIENESLCFLS